MSPPNSVFVLHLSKKLTEILLKILSQFLDKYWTHLFSYLQPGHTASGQILDKVWISSAVTYDGLLAHWTDSGQRLDFDKLWINF